MRVFAAYMGVIVIWSTTPLGIKWSNSSFSYSESIALRTVFALVITFVLIGLMRKKIFVNKSDWKPMAAGALSLFPNMLLVYWSAQYISSGLISVVFGSAPFFVGMFSLFILKENQFNTSKVIALCVAVIGLVLIHFDQLNLGTMAVWGVLGILGSSMMFAVSTVVLKKIGSDIEPVRQLAGSLLFSAPAFGLAWYVLDGELPAAVDIRSIIGVSYLVVAGSVLGGLAFYYVLGKCSVVSVSLIPLITPVTALILGYYIEDEQLGTTMLIGTALILLSLALYQGVIQNGLATYRRLKRLVLSRFKYLFGFRRY